MELTLWEQVANIHWTIYVLTGFILYALWRTTRPSILNIRIQVLIPVFLLIVIGNCVNLAAKFTPGLLIVCPAGLITGGIYGWRTYQRQPVRAIEGKKQLYFPGSYNSVMLFGMIAGIQLLYFVMYKARPAWHNLPLYTQTWFMFYSFFSGMLIGRLVYSLRCLKTGPYINEDEAII